MAGKVVPQRPVSFDVDVVSSLAAELRMIAVQRWATYYPDHGMIAPAISLTPRHFGFSIIFQADLVFPDRLAERFMIKIRRQKKHGSFVRHELTDRTLALSRAEFAEHVQAYNFFAANNEGLSVVRPLDFIESHNAFLVEHAAGSDLSKLVRAGSRLVSESIRRCGAWWRMFHYELHEARDRAWTADAIDTAVDRRLVRLSAIGAPQETLEGLRCDIRAAARRVVPSPVPVSLVHGDCKLRHVWATAEGIQVLDFGNAKVGDSWLDPAALVVELSLYSLWSRRLDSSAKAPDIQTLLRAYFEGPIPPAFSFYVVDCLLKKWHRRLRNWGSGTGMSRIRKSLVTAGLDKPLERLYIDRWFTSQIQAWLALADGRPPAWLKRVVE